MNFWKKNPEFWQERSQKYDSYAKQKQELSNDLRTLIEALKITTVIDVCGYRGEVKEMLPEGIKYHCLDIVDGFDVTYEWTHQLIEKNIVIDDPDHTLAFTSLSLFCFMPPAAQHIINQMKKYSRFQYYYEEKARDLPEGEVSVQIAKDYGGKWSYDWKSFIGNVDTFDSDINPAWVRIFSR